MKKYLILAATTVFVLGACSKNEVDVNVDKVPVTFGTYVGMTKATTGDIDLDGLKSSEDGFGVYCYYSDNSSYNSSSSTPNFMLNQKVYNSNHSSHSAGADATWTYTPIKYWPNEYGDGANSTTTDKLTFRAYAPYSTGSTNNISNLPDKNSTATTLTYTVDNSNQVDLLWASNAVGSLTDLTKKNVTVTSTVDFTFSHALSKITFSHQAVVDQVNPSSGALATGTTITLNSITIDGTTIKKSGVFNFATGEWGTLTAGATPTNDISLTSLNANVTNSLTAISNKEFFVIPNASNSMKITVDYTVNTADSAYGEGGTVSTNNTIYKTATFALVAGKVYDIKLLLGMTSIKVGVDVSDWGSPAESTEIDLPENKS